MKKIILLFTVNSNARRSKTPLWFIRFRGAAVQNENIMAIWTHPVRCMIRKSIRILNRKPRTEYSGQSKLNNIIKLMVCRFSRPHQDGVTI